MNKQEAVKLLALIKVAYPTAYRDMDEASKLATVNMWAMSFPDVPYPIMEQALNHHRMVSKFPPTVAEMVAELKSIYLEAMEQALIFHAIGDEEAVKKYEAIMAYTRKYKNDEHIRGLQMASLQKMLSGGEDDVQRFGTPGSNMRLENGLPLMDAAGRG